MKRRRRIYDDRFDGKLRGLDGELAFRLRQLIGCVVKFKVECGNECREFKGTVCHVGKDFVEIEKLHHDDHDHTRRKRDCKCKDRRRHKCKCKCKDHKSKFLIIPLDEIKIIKIVDDKKGHC
ncbi:hypothetical protein [Halalkalibacter krulwichiae]|uniref:hypothetical protein n=1 Tax=Halalkalibacter krulwichiae TaxID=199441 RepID=UPI00082454C2|nr:hypothetical protein [Halalkalibacter krulwichiae]